MQSPGCAPLCEALVRVSSCLSKVQPSGQTPHQDWCLLLVESCACSSFSRYAFAACNNFVLAVICAMTECSRHLQGIEQLMDSSLAAAMNNVISRKQLKRNATLHLRRVCKQQLSQQVQPSCQTALPLGLVPTRDATLHLRRVCNQQPPQQVETASVPTSAGSATSSCRNKLRQPSEAGTSGCSR